jgi:hypothetical protein
MTAHAPIVYIGLRRFDSELSFISKTGFFVSLAMGRCFLSLGTSPIQETKLIDALKWRQKDHSDGISVCCARGPSGAV